jgi:hypothetical protein
MFIMLKNIKIALLVAGLGLAAGCYTIGADYNDAAISEVKVGQTTESELVTKFGQPNYTTTNSDGSKVLTWTYVTGSNFIVTNESKSKNLEVTVFNGKATNVRSTYSSNYHDDAKK